MEGQGTELRRASHKATDRYRPARRLGTLPWVI